MEEVKDKKKIRISDLLKSHPEGLTIADIMKKTSLARHTVLARLHHLVGKGDLAVRQINMAKVHYWIGEKEKKDEVELNPINEENIKRKEEIPKKTKQLESPAKKTSGSEPIIDMVKIKEQIEKELKLGKLKKHEGQIKEQRMPISHVVGRSKDAIQKEFDEFLHTGVTGFDDLFEQGIPRGSSVLVAGGAGSGKTILTLQILNKHASNGEKCLYMSFEESEANLIHHMEDFGWKPNELIEQGNLLIKRFNPFDITRSVDALLMKARGELLIEIEPIIFPEDFKPDIIVVDSLTAIASAFTGKEDSYRIYIEQLFRFFEKIGATSFLITETKQIPTIFSQTGVEEFLADGVIVLYNIKRGNVRENAIEVLKLRGAKHKKKIVAMQIGNDGMVVYPDQEVFGDLGE